MPKYLLDSFWYRIEIDWFRKLIFLFCKKVINLEGGSFDLIGQPIIMHLLIPRFIPAHL